MAALVVAPSHSQVAFSKYKHSSNAHTDILSLDGQPTSTPGGAAPKTTKVLLSLGDHQRAISDEQVALLSTCASLVLASKPTPVSYHQIRAVCRSLVQGHHRALIHNNVVSELAKTVEQIARECRGFIMSKEAGWLDHLVSAWESLGRRVTLLAAVFVYLDRSPYTDSAGGNTTIQETARVLFCTHVWNHQLLFDRTRRDILAWVSAERDAGFPDAAARQSVRRVVDLAEQLGTFHTFAKPYLDLVQEHYEALSVTQTAKVEDGSLAGTDYVSWALAREREEQERATSCLSTELAPRVRKTLRHELSARTADRVLPKALDEALYRADTEALTRLYQFSIDASASETFSKALKNHIEARIRTLISDPANDPQMIESTLKLKRFVDGAVALLFVSRPARGARSDSEGGSDGDSGRDSGRGPGRGSAHDSDAEGGKTSEEVHALKESRQIELEESVRLGFKGGLESRQNAPAEWIAKYLDAAMRKGQGSGTEKEFYRLLDEIVALIGFTRDKDVFRAFYATGLAKRLLLNKSASDVLERNMIVKLQAAMGDEFTSGDIMMKDLQLSETLARSYQVARAKHPDQFRDTLDFAANVLTESAWPQYPLLKDGWNFKLTPELQASVDAFSAWYGTQHQNRTLSWRPQLGTVTLTARFEAGRYEIGVSLFQAVVLLQFNDVDVLTFAELQDRTGIEAAELVRTLQSLALGRKGTRVLLKRPMGRAVEPTDKFAFHRAFASERLKFRINQIQQDLSAEESRQTNEQVAVDRVSVLEATIVRVMKGRKTLTLALLVDEVVRDVSKRFPPDVREIKKRVESLIEREFLIRDDADRNTLNYLA